jgi:hypothetical protein
MKTCNICEKEHDGSFGSGKYCSRSCANKRTHTKTTKDKIARSVKKYNKVTNTKIHHYTCEKCGDPFSQNGRLRQDRVIHCSLCKRHVAKFKGEASSILELSNRTISKILKRCGSKCSNCGWCEAPCDIHHITPKNKGGADSHDNLVVLCPNCHRMAHHNKLDPNVLRQLSLEKTFVEWKKYYNIKQNVDVP